MMKINELARELKEKGMADSSEEASKMAEQFLKKNILPESSEKTDDYDKHEVLLERLQRKLNNELGSLKDQLSSVVNELAFLKEDIKRIKLAKIPEPVINVERVEEKPEQEGKQSTLAADEKKEPTNQRTGDLKPGDVNIEDYFYFGNKKR